MALGLTTTSSDGGNFLPRIQYDARAGRFFRVDRTQDSGGNWQSATEEIPLPMKVAIDLENIEVGWISFAGGQPDFKMVRLGEPLPPRPSDEHKQGFRVVVWNKALGARHWNHTARCVLAAVDALHDQYMAARGQNPGKVPVVTCTRTIPITTGQAGRQSTNYQPVFEIEAWIARPEAMATENAPQAQAPQAPQPSAVPPGWDEPAPRSAGQHMPPPAAKPAVTGADDPVF